MGFTSFQNAIVELFLYAIHWIGFTAIWLDQYVDAFKDYFKNKSDIEFMAMGGGSMRSGSSMGSTMGGNSGYSVFFKILFRIFRNPIAVAVLGIQLIIIGGMMFFGIPMLPTSITKFYGG